MNKIRRELRQNHILVLRELPDVGVGIGKLGGINTREILGKLQPQLDAQRRAKETAKRSLKTDVDIALTFLGMLAEDRKGIEKKQLAQIRELLGVLERHGFAAKNSKHYWHRLKPGHEYLVQKNLLRN